MLTPSRDSPRNQLRRNARTGAVMDQRYLTAVRRGAQAGKDGFARVAPPAHTAHTLRNPISDTSSLAFSTESGATTSTI